MKGIVMTYIYKSIVFLMLLGSTVMSAYAQLPEKGDWRTRVGIKAPEQVPAFMQAVFNNPPYNDPFAPLDSL